MPTQKQLAANRRNARLSTGPRTEEGKARASQNAVKHGFFAKAVLLPQEDAAEFDAFSQALHDDLHPQGALEEVLAAQVVVCAWRLQRLARIETGVFADFLSDATRHYAFVRDRDAQKRQTCSVAFPDVPEEAIWGHAFNHCNAKDEPLVKITRYINLVTREFYRALRELHRLQATEEKRGLTPISDAVPEIGVCPRFSDEVAPTAPTQNEPIHPSAPQAPSSVEGVSRQPSNVPVRVNPCTPISQNEPISAEEAPCPSGGKGVGIGGRGAHATNQNEPIQPSIHPAFARSAYPGWKNWPGA